MATLDEDLIAYLKADANVLRACGGRISQNELPAVPIIPYLWFQKTGEETFSALDDPRGVEPDIVSYSLECVGQSASNANAIAGYVKTWLQSAVKASFGTRTRTVFCEDQSDAFTKQQGGPGANGAHTAALQVRVFK